MATASSSLEGVDFSSVVAVVDWRWFFTSVTFLSRSAAVVKGFCVFKLSTNFDGLLLVKRAIADER